MPTFSEFDRELMVIALEEAQLAIAHEDVPIGAVIAVDGRVIARRHNERELTSDPTAHAEVLALRDAARVLGGWRFDGATMAVTIEPCVMCAGAIVNARVERLVFGAHDERFGAVETLFNIGSDERLNHRLEITSGVLAENCRRLLQDFFRARRARSAP